MGKDQMREDLNLFLFEHCNFGIDELKYVNNGLDSLENLIEEVLE